MALMNTIISKCSLSDTKLMKSKSAFLRRDSTLNDYFQVSKKPRESTDIVEKVIGGNNIEFPQNIKFQRITAENLNLKYTQLFSKSLSDNILDRLENEITYFSGNLLKIKVFGKWHNIPRKQVAFGDSGLTYAFSGNSLPAEPWNPLILDLKKVAEEASGQNYNFVLVNRYKDGEDHIGEHRDDEKDLVPDAPIASLSFGQPRRFVLRHKDSRGVKAVRKIDPVKMELEHGSLLIMESPTNNFWYHSLPKSKTAKNVRVNLTFRKLVG